MNIFKVLVLSLFMVSTFAEQKKKAKRVDIHDFLVSKKISKPEEPSTWSIAGGYQNLGTKIAHGEKSDSESFFPMGYESDLTMHVMSLQVNKEIMASNYISFTATGRYGLIRGSDSDVLNTENIQFEDSASGNVYGGGLTANLNMKGLGLRIQPFVGTQYIVHDIEYALSYGQVNGGVVPIQLTYNNKRTSLQHSLGVRMMDESKSLMSFISVDYLQNQSDDLSVFAKQGAREINITEPAEFEQNDLSFSLGFGFLF
jgi:hypothetical protein